MSIAASNPLFTPDARFDALWRDDVPAPVLPDARAAGGGRRRHRRLGLHGPECRPRQPPAADVPPSCSMPRRRATAAARATEGRSPRASSRRTRRSPGVMAPSAHLTIVKEGQSSLAWMAEFMRTEAFDCDYRVVGRFHAAHNEAQFKALVARGRAPAEGARGRGAYRSARGAAHRDRHRPLLRRRGIRAACVRASRALPRGAPRARAAGGRAGRGALPGDRDRARGRALPRHDRRAA